MIDKMDHNESHIYIYMIIYVRVVCIYTRYAYEYAYHSVSIAKSNENNAEHLPYTCKRYSTRPGSLVGLLESFPEPQSKIMEGSSGMAVSLPWYARNLLCDSSTTTGEVSENPWLKI